MINAKRNTSKKSVEVLAVNAPSVIGSSVLSHADLDQLAASFLESVSIVDSRAVMMGKLWAETKGKLLLAGFDWVNGELNNVGILDKKDVDIELKCYLLEEASIIKDMAEISTTVEADAKVKTNLAFTQLREELKRVVRSDDDFKDAFAVSFKQPTKSGKGWRVVITPLVPKAKDVEKSVAKLVADFGAEIALEAIQSNPDLVAEMKKQAAKA